MNCNDVYDSLEINGYKEFLPDSEYTRTIFKDCPIREQYKLERSENEFEQGSIYDKFKIVGDISLLKCVIFKGLGDEEKCKEWSGFFAREPRISGQTGYDVAWLKKYSCFKHGITVVLRCRWERKKNDHSFQSKKMK